MSEFATLSLSEKAPDNAAEALALLNSYLALPGNGLCGDCSSPAVTWASQSTHILICALCAGVHRSLGVEHSFVQSLTLDKWSVESVTAFASKGSTEEVNSSLLEYHVPAGTLKPNRSSDRADRESYIRSKYVARSFAPSSAVDERSAPLRPVTAASPAAGTAPAKKAATGELELIGVVMVKVKSCKDLINADVLSLSDPYIVLTLGRQTLKSKVILDNLNPVWNETIPMSWDGIEELQVSVFDQDLGLAGADDSLGHCTINLKELSLSGGEPHSVDRKLEGVKKGSIQLEFSLNTFS